MLGLVPGGGGGDKHGLRHQRLEFLELERAVVKRRRQAEAVIDQVFLARAVALVHAADLRHGDVRLVDDHQRVLRQVVDQRRRRLARLAPRKMPRVVLDALAEAQLGHHFEIETGALLQPLRLDQLAVGVIPLQAIAQLNLDLLDGP